MSKPPLVIDCGSGYCRIGFARENLPRIAFPTILSRPSYQTDLDARDSAHQVGYLAQRKRGTNLIGYPIEHGIVKDWKALEKILHYAIYEKICCAPDMQPLILTESSLNPKLNREKLAQLAFERYLFPSLYIGNQAVLSLYAAGLTTGLALCSGDGVTETVPVVEGYTMPKAIIRHDLGGRDLTYHLMRLATECGYSFTSPSEHEMVKEMKEKLCYVALDYKQEVDQAKKQKLHYERCYRLPDGQVVTIDSQRFKCPEALFQPSMLEVDLPGIHEQIVNSISACDVDVRKQLYANIVVSGGNTLFKGVEERLKQEVVKLAPRSTNVRLNVPRERLFSSWIGGSILGSFSTFRKVLVRLEEYDEHGPTIIHRKCL